MFAYCTLPLKNTEKWQVRKHPCLPTAHYPSKSQKTGKYENIHVCLLYTTPQKHRKVARSMKTSMFAYCTLPLKNTEKWQEVCKHPCLPTVHYPSKTQKSGKKYVNIHFCLLYTTPQKHRKVASTKTSMFAYCTLPLKNTEKWQEVWKHPCLPTVHYPSKTQKSGKYENIHVCLLCTTPQKHRKVASTKTSMFAYCTLPLKNTEKWQVRKHPCLPTAHYPSKTQKTGKYENIHVCLLHTTPQKHRKLASTKTSMFAYCTLPLKNTEKWQEVRKHPCLPTVHYPSKTQKSGNTLKYESIHEIRLHLNTFHQILCNSLYLLFSSFLFLQYSMCAFTIKWSYHVAL